jgi:hypothetical protein
MIVFTLIIVYWIIALILAMLFTRYNIVVIGDNIISAVFWPLTLIHYIIIYPFIIIDEKFPRKNRK